MSRFFFLVAFVGWAVLAVIVITAILALAGVDRFTPAVANPPI
jgi:hypothetical protein